MAKLVYTGNRNEILADLNTIAVLLKAAGVKSFDRTQAEALLDTLFTGEEKDLDFFGATGRMEKRVAKCGVEQFRLTVEFDEDGYIEGNKWLRRGIRMFRPLISGIAALVKGAKDTLAIGDKLSAWLDEMHSSNSQPEPDEPKSSEPVVVVPNEETTKAGITYALATVQEYGETILLRKSEEKDEVDIIDCTVPADMRHGNRWNDLLEKVVNYTNGNANAWRDVSEAKARKAYAKRVTTVANAPQYAIVTANFHTALLRLDRDADDYSIERCTMSINDDGYDAWLKEIDKIAYGKAGVWKKYSAKQAVRMYEDRIQAVPAPKTKLEQEMDAVIQKHGADWDDSMKELDALIEKRIGTAAKRGFHML